MTPNVTVDLVIDEPAWAAIALEEIAQKACRAGAVVSGLTQDVEVSILGADDRRISELNRAFREKDTATNVLSWPSESLGGDTGTLPRSPSDPELGDIAMSFQTCAKEAAEQGKSLHDHVTHLVLHGFLHLLGYDHVQDEDATLMESLEIKALETLGIQNPY